jgi:hypothetical protein
LFVRLSSFFFNLNVSNSVADPDPGSDAFLPQGSGIPDLGSRILTMSQIQYIFKILPLKMAKNRKNTVGSGINIPDPQHWFQVDFNTEETSEITVKIHFSFSQEISFVFKITKKKQKEGQLFVKC